MRLREIVTASFCFSEATNYSRYVTYKLGPGDVVCLVSMTGNQLAFVYRPIDVLSKDHGWNQEVLRSVRLRLSRGTWNPLMLTEYARRVGLKLDGLKRFAEFYNNGSAEREPREIPVKRSKAA